METFYWFRDGQFGEVQSYTWEGVRKALEGKFVYDPTESAEYRFCLIDELRGQTYIPRWAVPKEFLVKLMLLGVGV